MGPGNHVSNDPAPRSPTLRAFDDIGVAIALLVSAGVGIWIQLTYYTVQRFAQPVGADTSTYLWRSRLAGALGLNAIPGSSPFEFHANSSNPDRLGLPAMAAVLRWSTHVGPYRLMFVLPAICAAVLGLATWALARAAGEPRWAASVWGIAGATSVALAVTARGYFDNVLVDPLLVGAAALVLLSTEGMAGVGAAGVLLIVAAILVHFIIAGLVVVVFVLFAIALLPWSLRARPPGASLWTTPSGRVGAVIGASAVLGGAGLLLTPGSNVFQNQGRASYAKTLSSQLPLYRLPVTVTVAVLGALGLGLQGGGRRLRALTLFVIWGGLIALGGLAYALGMSVPVQRLLGLALPLTFLGAAALTWIVKLATSPGGAVRWALGGAAWVLIAAGLVAFGWIGDHALSGVDPMWAPADSSMAHTAATYLKQVDTGGPVIFVVDRLEPETDFGMIEAFRRLRATVPGRMAPRVVVYLGDPKNLLAGKPTYRPGDEAFNAVSKLYWDRLGPYVRPDAIVMAVATFDVHYAALVKKHPEWELTPGVLLIRGPKPPTPVMPAPLPVTPAATSLLTWTVLPLVLFLVCGVGWAVSLVPLGWAERATLAPVLGMAAVIVVAYLGGVVGLPMHDAWPVVFALVAAAAGWLPAIVRRFRGPEAEVSGQGAPTGEADGVENADAPSGAVTSGEASGEAAPDIAGS